MSALSRLVMDATLQSMEPGAGYVGYQRGKIDPQFLLFRKGAIDHMEKDVPTGAAGDQINICDDRGGWDVLQLEELFVMGTATPFERKEFLSVMSSSRVSMSLSMTGTDGWLSSIWTSTKILIEGSTAFMEATCCATKST